MVELEHNMKKDAVNRGLKERSDMNTLVEAGIQSISWLGVWRAVNPSIAPSIRANVASLERNMKKDQVFSSALFSLQLNRSLSDRPDESVLMEQGKMMGRRNVETDSAIDQMAASLQPTEKKLDMQFKKSSVEQK